MAPQIIEQLSLTLLLIAAAGAHMTPAFLAHQSAHPQRKLITAVNLLPGIGWFLGLALLTSSHLALRKVLADV